MLRGVSVSVLIKITSCFHVSLLKVSLYIFRAVFAVDEQMPPLPKKPSKDVFVFFEVICCGVNATVMQEHRALPLVFLCPSSLLLCSFSILATWEGMDDSATLWEFLRLEGKRNSLRKLTNNKRYFSLEFLKLWYSSIQLRYYLTPRECVRVVIRCSFKD